MTKGTEYQRLPDSQLTLAEQFIVCFITHMFFICLKPAKPICVHSSGDAVLV